MGHCHWGAALLYEPISTLSITRGDTAAAPLAPSCQPPQPWPSGPSTDPQPEPSLPEAAFAQARALSPWSGHHGPARGTALPCPCGLNHGASASHCSRPGQVSLAASCKGANFMYTGSFSMESGELGSSRGRGALPWAGGVGQRGAKAMHRERGSSSHWGYGEAGSKSQRHLARHSSVEGCQGLFSETSLMVTSRARGNTNPASLAQPDPSQSCRVCETAPPARGWAAPAPGRNLN